MTVLVSDLITMHVSWLLCMLPKILSLDLLLFNTSIHPEAEFHTCNGEQFKIMWLELFWKCKTTQIGGMWIQYSDYPVMVLYKPKEKGSYGRLGNTSIEKNRNNVKYDKSLIFKNLQSYQFCVNTLAEPNTYFSIFSDECFVCAQLCANNLLFMFHLINHCVKIEPLFYSYFNMFYLPVTQCVTKNQARNG